MKLVSSMLLALASSAGSVALAVTHSSDSPPGLLDSFKPVFESVAIPFGDLSTPAMLEASWTCYDTHPGAVRLSWSLNGNQEILLAEDLSFASAHSWSGTAPGTYNIWLRAYDAFGNCELRESTLNLDQVVAADEDVPMDFCLQPAQPNPFNPSTLLRFSLPETAQISLSVHNLRGERIVTLYQGLAAGGNHEVLVNASTWSSGVYLALLESEGRNQVQKLVLVK